MTRDEDGGPGAGPRYPLARGGLEEGGVLERVAHVHRDDQDSSAYLPLSNRQYLCLLESHLEWIKCVHYYDHITLYSILSPEHKLSVSALCHENQINRKIQ